MDQSFPTPSAGVPPHLLPHVACVSTYKYPILPQLSLDTTVDYLLQAPKVTREVSSMTWTFVDTPPDGTVMLVWQPHGPNQPMAQPRFPTDGYVWLDAERCFTQPYKGYNVEMHIHKIGYLPGHEALATHSRRRYRLTQIEGSNAQCDSSLWIVHYCRAEQQEQVPVSRVTVPPHLTQMLHQRRALQQQGQLVRKEFMLHDKANWPQLTMPAGMPPQQGHPQGMMPHMGRPQHPYGPGMDSGGPPSKRPRQVGPMSRPGPVKMPIGPPVGRDSALEEEHEDPDMFDLLTPRDISHMRYIKHHEWMEEIFSSPWDTLQIEPVPLGLGRRGPLSSLTDGYLDAPTEASIRTGPEVIAKPLGMEKYAELEKRTEEMTAALRAEIEQMKLEHNRQLETVTKGNLSRIAEKGIRTAAPRSGDDPFKLESISRPTSGLHSDVPIGTVDEITEKVEKEFRKHVAVLDGFVCVSKGGLEEKEPPTPPPGPSMEDTEMADGPQDALTGSPNFAEFTTELDDLSQPAGSTSQPTPAAAQTETIGLGTGEPDASGSKAPGPSEQVTGDDWVMIDKQSAESPSTQANIAEAQSLAPSSTAPPANSSVPPTTTSADIGADLVNFDATPGADVDDFEGGEFNDQIDFGNLDTAGEALEGFDTTGSGDNGGLQEDSAFGDAFHVTETDTADKDTGGHSG